jgi:hypothetical protein
MDRQLAPPSVLRKTPSVPLPIGEPTELAPANTVEGLSGSIAIVVTHVLFRPLLAVVQLDPPSTVLTTLADPPHPAA